MLTTSQGITSAKTVTLAAAYSVHLFEDEGRWWIALIGLFDYKSIGPFTTYASANERARELQ